MRSDLAENSKCQHRMQYSQNVPIIFVHPGLCILLIIAVTPITWGELGQIGHDLIYNLLVNRYILLALYL